MMSTGCRGRPTLKVTEWATLDDTVGNTLGVALGNAVGDTLGVAQGWLEYSIACRNLAL